jgi:hypothetical protein
LLEVIKTTIANGGKQIRTKRGVNGDILAVLPQVEDKIPHEVFRYIIVSRIEFGYATQPHVVLVVEIPVGTLVSLFQLGYYELFVFNHGIFEIQQHSHWKAHKDNLYKL